MSRVLLDLLRNVHHDDSLLHLVAWMVAIKDAIVPVTHGER